ncbi:ATP-binding protein [Listeria rustica]|uniref:AAA family ATPase n=1 Tax=Listeria rustica TaxID=2713503 RepID=A0A7W1T571_9LIST|nr:AAA family ATPase [Listeria rustica]
MALQTPFKAVQDNLLLTKTGDIWAYYQVSPQFIPTGNQEGKQKVKNDFDYFFSQLEKYHDFELQMIPKGIDLEGINNTLYQDIDANRRKVAHYYIDESRKMLQKQLGRVTRYDFILGVKLKKNVMHENDAKSQVTNAISSVENTILSIFNLVKEVDDSFFERFKVAENDLFQLASSIKAKKLSEDELVYVNRYNFIRDMEHSVERESQKRDIHSITDSIIDPTQAGYIKLQTAEGECYMTHVVVDSFHADMRYSHVFECAQYFPFSTEVRIKAQFREKGTMLRKTNTTMKRMKVMGKEKMEQGGNVEDSVKQSRALMERLENQLSADEKFLQWRCGIVVTGVTKEACKQRAKYVTRVLAQRKIVSLQPSADQLQLFYQFLPAEPLKGRNWLQQTTTAGFAENLFAVSQRIGNNVGFYLGRLNRLQRSDTMKDSVYSSRDIVLFHPYVANKGIEGAITDSPHISITGQTGKGKSFLVDMLLMFLSKLKVKTLYVDPKTAVYEQFKRIYEDPVFQKKYPLFCEELKSFNYVNLDADDPECHGVLDPLVMLEGSEAKDTAQAIIEQIYNLDNKDDIKRVLLQKIDEVVREREEGKKVGFMHVIERMISHENVAVSNAGKLLDVEVKHSILQLVFSKGETKGLNTDADTTILGIKGLDLPDKEVNPDSYDSGEKKAVALMIPLSKFCRVFGKENRKQQTAIIFDEAWMLAAARQGAKLIMEMRRVGRQFNNMLILVTQSVNDCNTDADSGNFGVNFAFDEDSERKDILRYLNLEVNEKEPNANETMLANMIKGECLFKDIYGRTGKLAVHCLFEEWTEAFKTVEHTHSSEAESKFAS